MGNTSNMALNQNNQATSTTSQVISNSMQRTPQLTQQNDNRSVFQESGQNLRSVKKNAPQNQNQAINRPQFVLEKQTNSIKNQVHGAISKRELKNLKRIIRLFRVDPNEELSVKGYFWTGLHYAVHFKAEEILEFMIKLAFRLSSTSFIDVLNVQTKEGWSPAMIACIYKSHQSLAILLKYGGIKLNLLDKNGRNIMELAKYYRAVECIEILKQFNEQNPNVQTSTINLELLENSETLQQIYGDLKGEDDKKPVIDANFTKKYRDLLLKGERLPCVICLSNLGFIKYTDCCGQPIHQGCKGNKICTCPFCKKPGFQLSSDIFYPERAFALEEV